LLKVGVSTSILAVILSRISFGEVLARASAGAPVVLAAAFLLVVLVAVLVALRWRVLANWLGLAVPAGLAVRALFLGFFGGQVLPSALGVDVVRGYVVARHAGATGRVAASVIADRLVGLFALCLLLFIANPVLPQVPPPYGSLVAPAAVLASGTVLLAFVVACTRGWRSFEGVVLRAAPIAAAIILALAVHALAVATACMAARAYGIDASLAVWGAIIPLSLLASAVPVSISGWGVREVAIIALAAPLGVPAPEALLVSLTLGVLNVLASLPGALFLLRWHRPDLV
jgi:glycosyltransferase 2 family protein